MAILDKLDISLAEYFAPQANGKFGVKIAIGPEATTFSKSVGTELISVSAPVGKFLVAKVLNNPATYAESFASVKWEFREALLRLSVKVGGDAPMDPDPDPQTSIVAAVQKPIEVPEGPVPLRDAVSVYQPVHGTSQGSVYHVAALSDDLRVAVRATSGKISIRVEGDIDSHKDAITSAGLGIKSGGSGYASAHFAAGDKQTAARTLGAVLMGVGGWTTPMPNFENLWGKGIG